MRGGFSEDVFLMCRRSVKWHEEEWMARCLILTLINFSVLSQSPQLHPNFSFYRKGSGPWWRRGFGGSGECGDIERVRKEQSKLWIFPELSFGTESIKILIIKSQTFIFKNKPRLLFCFVICLGAFFFFLIIGKIVIFWNVIDFFCWSQKPCAPPNLLREELCGQAGTPAWGKPSIALSACVRRAGIQHSLLLP